MKDRKPRKQTTSAHTRPALSKTKLDMDKENNQTCIAFTIWVGRKKFKAGAHAGTTVTIDLGGRVIGLSPTMSSADPKRVSVALLNLKSHDQDVSDGKVVSRVKVPFGQSASFAPAENIRFSARPSFEIPLPAPKKPKCCVIIEGGARICATCYVVHGKASCCTSLLCCLRMIWDTILVALPS